MKRKYEVVVLSGILLLAAAVRLWGIDYGLPCTYCRPDEDRLINTALRLSLQDPNPHYFIWPGFFFYFTRGILEAALITGRLVGGVPGNSTVELHLADPAYFHRILRYLFCAFGTATVYLLYRLGKRLFSTSTGLLAAFFLSLAFIHVRDSHFAMLDIPATLLGVAFFLPAWCIYRRGRWGDYILAGALLGLATATKYYACLLSVPLVVAHFSMSGRGGGSHPVRPRARLPVALGLAVLIFALTSPYTILDAASFIREIKKEIMVSQYIEGFYLVRGLSTARGWLYHIVFSLRYGLGWPLEILSLIGVGFAVWRTARGRAPERLVLSFILPFYLMLSFQRSCFIRYTTMLLPFLCLLGGELLRSIWSRLGCSVVLLMLLSISIMSESAIRVIALDRLLSRPDTRNLAGEWMEENIPREAGVIFPQPFIFGRPTGFFRFPNRVSLPEGKEVKAIEYLLACDIPEPKYAIIHRYPLSYSSLAPGVRQMMNEAGEEVFRVESLQPGFQNAVFDPFDAFYVPLAGFRGVTFPGPDIRIYRLDTKE